MGKILNIINDNSLSDEKKVLEIDSILSSVFFENSTELSQYELIFEYVEELEREVNNGGFDQFFFNSAGNYTEDIVSALKEIGALYTADLVSEAAAQFPNKQVPKDRDTRQEVMESLPKEVTTKWDELDHKFYEYTDNLSELLIGFVKSHLDSFTH
ncbi:hypothetical protein A2415_03170 [candidate division WWE3 bacterium RIFOXYC1_FULL_39_7]|uniref:DNA mimic protein DMP19 C-terminal domain-containing protein n=2 Tax=Katanobacteria TaxID=422282 RepID=A0A1F4X3U4_UNCKA|nr:MAG: hypothetical protein A2415_03170 [candidate division WWE3 bacterium RIFOXYC1_FULL_39_7]OGC76372.1 MAG: hypothetical protein A2619_00245 [candidate division WWE3 bacterium RIFOXYD1_FULL_39_9]